MIRLSTAPALATVDLGHGVTITHRPVTAAVFEAAQAAMREAAGLPVMPGKGGAAPAITREVYGEMSFAFALEIAALTIVDWTEVGDPDGLPVDPSRPYIEALLAHEPFYKAFNEKVVGRALLLLDQKN
jgi:hypothetical protein